MNFVEDEQRTHLVATSPQGFEPSGNRGPYARFALHGFDHDAGRAAGDESQLVEIVEVDRPHIGQQRPERALPLLAFGLTHQAHGSLRRTVIGPAHRDQLRAVGVSLGELQGPFDRFGARIDEIDARKFSRQQLGDACGVPHLRPLDHLAIDHDVHVVGRLPLHGFHHAGIGMADVADRNPRHQIVVAFAFGCIEKNAFCPRHLDHHGFGRGLADVGQKLFA